MGDKTIEVERTKESGERSWRAVLRLPKHLALTGYSICGAQTDAGPWIEGYGYTPEGAIQAAYITIGKAVMSTTPIPAEVKADAS